MRKLLSQIIAAGLGLWLATLIIPGVKVSLLSDSNFFGVSITQQWQIFLVLGIILGLLNYFVKPVLKILALPLEIITLGLFSIAISMAMIWIVSLIFEELTVPLFLPLFLTSVIIWISNFIIQKILIGNDD
ncbi:MAG: phage holin family protein [Patescibacteria group bacterium]